MKIPLDLTPGDFLDRLSIARIRAEKLQSEHSKKYAQFLQHAAFKYIGEQMWERCSQLRDDLYQVNTWLWIAEDKIRLFEQADAFGPQFVEIARAIYRYNDMRSAIKRRIDLMFDEAPEEKNYASTRPPSAG